MGADQKPGLLSSKGERTTAPPISWLMKSALDRPDLISLAVGFADQETLPTRAVLASCRAILRDEERGRAALQYGTTIGLPSLRASVLELLADDGLSADACKLTPDNVVITTGSQSLLYLVTEVLVDPGDVVIISDPDYFVYMGVLQGVGADVRGVTLESDGISIEGIRRVADGLRREGKIGRLKLIYVVSYFQNPSGVTMSARKRKALAGLARELRPEAPLFILEDGAYRELRYSGKREPPLKSFDTENDLVAYAGTFCKSFSAGLKTGYGILPDALTGPVLAQKGNLDFGSCHFAQCIVDEAIRSGRYRRHLARVRRGYKAKLESMLAALKEFMPRPVRWLEPRGGLYVWLATPDGVDTGPESPLFKSAVEKGVLYVPGEFCFYPEAGRQKPRNWMRLSFGVEKIDTVREGVRRLGEAMHEVMGQAAMKHG